MGETRKLAAILVADIVGYSRLAGADEDRILARLRTLRSDLIDPILAVHHGRVVKRTGDGAIIEFRSVVDAVRCAIEVQSGLAERNAGLPPEKRIEYRVGIHLGDVVEESDGDLMGDGVNIAARLEGVAKPGTICLSEDAYRQVSGRLEMAVTDLGPTKLKNIDKATSGPQLGHALQSLDETLTRLDKVTHDIEPDIKSLVKSLRDTADSAQNTLNTVQGLMGNTAPTGTDLPRLMRELTEAARSVRGLADYLDRHPEALLRGRKGDDKQ